MAILAFRNRGVFGRGEIRKRGKSAAASERPKNQNRAFSGKNENVAFWGAKKAQGIKLSWAMPFRVA